MIDKIVYGRTLNAFYINEYTVKDDYVEIHIYGGKNKAYIKIDKDDYEFVSSHYWSLKNMGREGHARIYATTIISKKLIKMSRLMLEVNDPNLRVEHKDRDCLNLKRENLYIVDKKDLKSQKSLTGEDEVLGVNARWQNGSLTGYSVDYKKGNKKHTKYFGKLKYRGIDNAKNKAIDFRKRLKLSQE